MIKTIPPGAWGRDAFPAPEVVKYASTGLRGADLSAFVKRASHPLATWVRNNPPQPGDVYLHLIAMGATEKFGQNRNGDLYGHEMLLRDTPTFKKYAKWYLNHKNRDPNISFGPVKEAMYDPDLGRVELLVALNGTKEAAERNGGLVAERTLHKLASGMDVAVSMSTKVPGDFCFPSGTLIETEEGLSPIEAIRSGHVVKSAAGVYREVKETFRREFSGSMVDIEVTGLLDQTSMTPEHPVLVVRELELRTCRGSVGGKRRRHTFRKGHPTCVTCSRVNAAAPQWAAAETLTPGDYLVYPVERPGDVVERPEYCYVLGLYLGDGSGVYERRGADRSGERYLTGVSFSLGDEHPEIIATLQARLGVLSDKPVGVYRAGRHSDGTERKAVQVVIHDRELAAKLLADAGEYSDKKRLSRRVFQLNEEGRTAFLAGYMDSDGAADRDRTGMGRFTTTNRILAGQIQRLIWGLNRPAFMNSQLHDAETLLGGKSIRTYVVGTSDAYTLCGRYGVKAATAYRPRSTHSPNFVAGDWVYLKVTSVRRRDATCEVFNFSVDVDESYVANGFAVHNCNGCGHFARNRSEYCTAETCKYGGCMHNLGRVFDDGHHLGVDNRNCTFFDISDVSDTRGADRTAFVTGKVAGHYVPGGAELAEQLGIVSPDYLLEPNQLAQLRCLRKLAAAASKVGVDTTPAWETCVAVRAKVAADRGLITRGYEIPKDAHQAHALVADLAADGVILPPAQYLEAVAGVPADKVAGILANRLDPERDLLARADCHDYLTGTYVAREKGAYTWLAPTAKGFGLEAARALGGEKVASGPQAPEALRAELAARYTSYQAAVLAAHENSPNFPLLLADAARHTRCHSA